MKSRIQNSERTYQVSRQEKVEYRGGVGKETASFLGPKMIEGLRPAKRCGTLELLKCERCFLGEKKLKDVYSRRETAVRISKNTSSIEVRLARKGGTRI